jgi:hypothetical protein
VGAGASAERGELRPSASHGREQRNEHAGENDNHGAGRELARGLEARRGEAPWRLGVDVKLRNDDVHPTELPDQGTVAAGARRRNRAGSSGQEDAQPKGRPGRSSVRAGQGRAWARATHHGTSKGRDELEHRRATEKKTSERESGEAAARAERKKKTRT